MTHTEETRARAYEKVKKRKADWFTQHGPCAFCGSSDRLELDHIDPELKVSHNIWSWSEKRRNEELAKCQPLCYSCHKGKTKSQKENINHGTTTMYRKGCRCDGCKDAHRTYRNDHRAKTGKR